MSRGPSVGDFSQASPSIYALSAGKALEIVNLDTQLQMKNYELQQLLRKVEGETAQGLGSAIKNSIDQQAEATRFNAVALITQGGTIAGMEGASVGYGKLSPLNKEIDKANEKLGNVNSWEERIKKLNEENSGGIQLERMGQKPDEALENAKRNLQSRDFSKDKVGEFSDDLEAVQGTGSIAEVKKDLRAQKKETQKDKDTVQNALERIQQRISSMAQAIGYVAQGSIQTAAAQAQARQAEFENERTQAQFALDSTQRADRATGEIISNAESAKQAAIRSILEGIAQNNRV